MKTIVVYGMFVKQPHRGMNRGDYTNVDWVYNVDDGVTIDDVVYMIESKRVRMVPIGEDREKLDYVVGVDRNRVGTGPVLNRFGLSQQIKKDFEKLEWQRDRSTR